MGLGGVRAIGLVVERGLGFGVMPWVGLSGRSRNRKGIKLGGCLRKQGVGKYTNTPTLGLLGTKDVPSQDMPLPHTSERVGAPFLHVTSSRRAARRLEP